MRNCSGSVLARALLSLAVAAVLLLALFRWGGLELADLAYTLRRLSPGNYLSALGLHVGIYLLRAARFRQLIPPPSRPSFAEVLGVSSAHNLAAYVLPAKTGEATFVVYLKAVCGVPGSEGLASLLVSRLLDLTVLIGSIALASLALAASDPTAGGHDWLLPLGATLLVLAALSGLVCARSLWLVQGFVLLSRLLGLGGTRIGQRLHGRSVVVGEALSHAGAEGRLLGGALISIPIWLGVFLFYAVLARGLGLGEPIGLVHAAFGSGLATVANLLPINGLAGFGTQEAGWVVGFHLLGVPRDLALSTGVGVHLVQLFNVVLLGILGHLSMGFADPARRRRRGPAQLPSARIRSRSRAMNPGAGEGEGEGGTPPVLLDSHPPMAARHTKAQIEMHRALAPRYAYRYGFEFSRLFQEDWHAEMISHVPPGAREILDLGCGTGFFLAELETRHRGSVGLDISHDMLKVSEQYVPGVKLVTGDAERLPFRPGIFDVVFCKGSLHHTRDHVGFLANCRQALRPGGVLIMSEPCNDNPLIRLARRLMYRRSAHFDEGDLGFTRRGIIDLCQAAGFELMQVKKYGVLAYVFAGFPDHLGLLRFVPGNALLTRLFIRLDRVICALPGLSLLGFHVIVVARPETGKWH